MAEASLKQMWMAKAPVHVVVVAEPEKAKRYYGDRGEKLYSIQNCAAAAQNMLLEAHNLGLGTCWVGAFDKNVVRRALGIPEESVPQIIITIGYADEYVEVPIKLPLESVMYFNGWRSRIRNPAAYMGYYSAGLKKNVLKGKEILEKTGKKAVNKTKELAEKIKEKLNRQVSNYH